jgi:hypothetical protein
MGDPGQPTSLLARADGWLSRRPRLLGNWSRPDVADRAAVVLWWVLKHIGFLSFGHWAPSPHSQTRSASEALLQSIDLAVAAEELGAFRQPDEHRRLAGRHCRTRHHRPCDRIDLGRSARPAAMRVGQW